MNKVPGLYSVAQAAAMIGVTGQTLHYHIYEAKTLPGPNKVTVKRKKYDVEGLVKMALLYGRYKKDMEAVRQSVKEEVENEGDQTT